MWLSIDTFYRCSLLLAHIPYHSLPHVFPPVSLLLLDQWPPGGRVSSAFIDGADHRNSASHPSASIRRTPFSNFQQTVVHILCRRFLARGLGARHQRARRHGRIVSVANVFAYLFDCAGSGCDLGVDIRIVLASITWIVRKPECSVISRTVLLDHSTLVSPAVGRVSVLFNSRLFPPS